jgi:hypothetical protein
VGRHSPTRSSGWLEGPEDYGAPYDQRSQISKEMGSFTYAKVDGNFATMVDTLCCAKALKFGTAILRDITLIQFVSIVLAHKPFLAKKLHSGRFRRAAQAKFAMSPLQYQRQ